MVKFGKSVMTTANHQDTISNEMDLFFSSPPARYGVRGHPAARSGPQGLVCKHLIVIAFKS